MGRKDGHVATPERLTDGLSVANFFCSIALFRQSQFPDLTGCVADRQSLALKDQSLVPSPPAPFISAICRRVAVLARQEGPANIECPRWPT
jgi:hypothetical protein